MTLMPNKWLDGEVGFLKFIMFFFYIFNVDEDSNALIFYFIYQIINIVVEWLTRTTRFVQNEPVTKWYLPTRLTVSCHTLIHTLIIVRVVCLINFDISSNNNYICRSKCVFQKEAMGKGKIASEFLDAYKIRFNYMGRFDDCKQVEYIEKMFISYCYS